MPNDDLSKNGIVGSEYWINSANKSFSDLVIGSRLYPEWGVSGHVFDKGYTNKFLVPVNRYAEIFHNKPELIINDDHVVLRQKTHAEIWIEPKYNGLYALDKCWQRQFYPSDMTADQQDVSFNALYKFYLPWMINKDIECEISNNFGEETVFNLITDVIYFNKVDFSKHILDTRWIHFFINKTGKHMKDERYGIIDIGTPICDIIIRDSETIEQIKKEYSD